MSSWKPLLMILSAAAAFLSAGIAYFQCNIHGGFLEKDYVEAEPAVPSAAHSGRRTFLLSEDPLIVYIKDFITPTEAAHLVGLA